MDPLEKEYKALSTGERMELALRPELPATFRRLLARDQWMQVKCYFARRLDLDTAEVSALLEDPDHVIRLCLAKRGDLDPAQVARCVADRDPNVRYFIARNPLITAAQRERLLADEDELVRRAAAKGPRPPRTRQRPGQAALVR